MRCLSMCNKRKGTPQWKTAEELAESTGYNVEVCYKWVTGQSDPWANHSMIMKEINDLILTCLAITNDQPRSYRWISRASGLTHQNLEEISRRALRKLSTHPTIQAIKNND